MDPLIWAVAALTLVCALLVALLHSVVQSSARERDENRKERRELADRIQAPHTIPNRDPQPDVKLEEREPDEWGKVGSIHIDDAWLTADED